MSKVTFGKDKAIAREERWKGNSQLAKLGLVSEKANNQSASVVVREAWDKQG